MKLFLKILLFIFTMIITIVGEVNSSTMVSNFQKEISYSFHQEPQFCTSTFENSCVNGEKVVAYSEQVTSIEANAAKGGQSLVQTNRAAGNLFRDELATALRAEGRTVYTEAYKSTPFGKRYMDIDVWYNGVNLGGIETKIGSSRYLPLQRLKDFWLDANGYPVQLVRKPPYW